MTHSTEYDATLETTMSSDMLRARRDSDIQSISLAESGPEDATRPNQLLPVYRLPNEVYAIIFELVWGSKSNQLRPLLRSAPLNISHVSRLWRDITLAMPGLWAKIDPINAPMSQLFLDRSKNHLLHIELHIYYDDYSDFTDDSDPETPGARLPMSRKAVNAAYEAQVAKFPEFVGKVLPYINRWGYLKLFGLNQNRLRHLLPTSVPQLRRLALYNSRVPPAGMLGEHQSPLHELQLTRTAIPLTSRIFTGLIALRLADIDYRGSSAQQLLHVLASCPSLTRLAISDVSFSPARVAPQLKRISLLHLKEMILSIMTDGVCYDILSNISISSSLKLTVTRRPGDRDLGDTFPPPSYIKEHLPNIPVIQNLKLKQTVNSVIRISGDSGIANGGSPLLNLSLISASARFPETDSLISTFSQYLPLPSLQSISIHEIHQWLISTTAFTDFIRDIPTLTSLSMTDSSSSFVKALIAGPDSHLCPSLQKLHIEKMTVDPEVLLALVKCRTKRIGDSQEPPFRRLSVVGCRGIDEASVFALRNLRIEVAFVEKSL